MTFAAGFLGVCSSALAQSATPNEMQTLIDRGKIVATGADCMACHTVPHKGKPFAGGYPIVSPLGTIYSTNITPSKTQGIGTYTEEDFSKAVRKGIRKDGGHLYPAMPYDAYAEMTDSDVHALYAYFMKGVAPVDDKPADLTSLPFPFNMRFSMAFWNMLYANKEPFKPDPSKSDELNRGAYVAGALGHCASCHTPRGPLMGEDSSGNLAGGPVGPWHAPNITSDPISGIGDWSNDELVQYFRTGHADGKNQAAGGMAEAVQNSLQYLPDTDLKALAAYLKSVPPIRDPADNQPAHGYGTPHSDEASIRGASPFNAHDSLKTGADLYAGYCASCHQPNGAGSENQAYPSLFHNTATGANQTANLISTILYGVERETGGNEVLMPAFGKQSFVQALTDQQIVDISNYVLEHYGISDAQVTLKDVAVARAGGPIPLLAKAQPFVLPVIVISILLVITATIFLILSKRRKTAAAG
ncbi:cytochrome c [Neorhizobium sp. JUb45]|uniref:cytochrome c n=1 Tax=Neorhizobium sp. JUb45 TaxID=2485113 RepID=UPI0010443829|nr:cytochrome c [Neorhizobium sp. JUb45]